MIYQPQINYPNASNTNLDDAAARLVQDVLIDLISTVESLLSLGTDANLTLYIISLKN